MSDDIEIEEIDYLDSGFVKKFDMNTIEEETQKLGENEQLYIGKEQIKKTSAPYAYLAVGNGKKLKRKNAEPSIDIIKEMVEMPKDARKVLDFLKDCMLNNAHEYGIISYSMTDWSKQEKKSWGEGINYLMKKDFIRKIKRANYIISPKLIVPTGDPRVEQSLGAPEKKKRHQDYIRTIMQNWEKALINLYP